MSEKIDRRIESNRVLLVTAIILFALAAAAGFFVWLDMRSTRTAPAAEEPSYPDRHARADEPLMVSLLLPLNGALVSGAAGVKRQPDTQGQAREVLIGLLTDPGAVRSPVLRELKLREFYLDAAGTAYADLAVVPPEGIKASGWEELLAVYSIVNTLMQNLEEIRQVRFLIEGREAQTLAGHIDLSGKFRKRMDLVRR